MGPPVREVVRRRRAQRRLQLRRPPRRERPRRQGRVPLDRRARRHPDADLRRPPCARVSKAANALLELGVTKGDRVAIYMPMIPELPIAMLACARIGAPHTVVFGGFSAEALAGRINDCGAKVLITADGGWRRGKKVGLKHHADEAVARHADDRARPRRRPLRRRRATWSRAATSGGTTSSTARPRTARRCRSTASTCSTCSTRRARPPSPRGSCTRPPATCSGTAFTHWAVFDIKPDDVYWCAADIGWVTGPLATSSTGRWPTRRRASCTRARPTRRPGTAGGRSSRTTRSRSCTARRRRSGRS